MIQITIPGTIRIKKNSRRLFQSGKRSGLKTGCGRCKSCFPTSLPSVAYKDWEKKARSYTVTLPQMQKFPSDWPTGSTISVWVMAYYKGPRPDLSGVLESVGDAFEGILWKNDRQIISWDGRSRLIHDKENPRLELTVTLME